MDHQLKLPKRVKKSSLLTKLKEKNRSTGPEKDKFQEKIKLFNKQLNRIFSDRIENERMGMVVFTELAYENVDLTTYIDEEGKERMTIDWSSDFDDSIYENMIDNVESKRLKTQSTTDSLSDTSRLDASTKDESIIKQKEKWKGLKNLFKKDKKRDEIPLAELVKRPLDEPIYEELDQSVYENVRLDPRANLTSTPMKIDKKQSVFQDRMRGVKQESPEGSLNSTGFVPEQTMITGNIPPPPPMPGQLITKMQTAGSPTRLAVTKKQLPSRPPPPFQMPGNIPPPPPMPGNIPPPPPMPGQMYVGQGSPEQSFSKRKRTTSSSRRSSPNESFNKSKKGLFDNLNPLSAKKEKRKSKSKKDERNSRIYENLLKDKKVGKVDKRH